MELFDKAASLKKYNIPFALVTLLGTTGTAPRTEGRMLVLKSGEIYGTVGGGAMEAEAAKIAARSISENKGRKISLPVRKDGMAELFIDIPVKDRCLVIVGAGHVALELEKLFYSLGWRTYVIDRRPELLSEERFSHSTLILADDFSKALDDIDINRNTAVVITSPEEGDGIIEKLSESEAFYLGMLGSRKKERKSIKKLSVPMGLDIGGEEPVEVALSIAGEVLAKYNNRPSGFRSSFRNNLVIVRGAGDLATGTIIRLRNAGYDVIALEIEKPTVIRRTVSFADALFEGECTVEGVRAVKAKDINDALSIMDRKDIPILVDPEGAAIKTLKPFCIVDAILAKKNLGTTIDMAPFVVALGPGFEAGKDVDAVIETKRGHNLGRIIRDGSAIANTGIPGIIGGYGKERVMHSKCEGIFKGAVEIGKIVKKGDVIAYIDETPVLASLDGRLRGLLHDGLFVPKGFKIADIDPRGEETDHLTISDKARAIAGGVLEAIDSFRNNR